MPVVHPFTEIDAGSALGLSMSVDKNWVVVKPEVIQ
jgi:hypothetical protein